MRCRLLFSALAFLGFAFPLLAQSPNIAYLKRPLAFEPNQGQVSSQVRFLSRGNGHSFLLSDRDAVLTFADPALSVRMALVGQNPRSRIEGVGTLPGVTNYLHGNDPQQWHRSVPHFAKVRYSDVYPGIDLIYYGSDGQLEYDFEVRPDSDPSQVEIEFQGMETLRVDPAGDLVLHTAHGDIRHHRPIAYQNRDGITVPVDVQFRLQGRRVSFELGVYNPRLPLVIDPKLVWSSYIGGPGGDQSNDIAIDSAGSVYLTGITQAIEVEPAGVLNPPSGKGFEAFVTKVDPTGAVVYTTYFGGSGTDEGHSIAVDSSGAAYVTGYTTSSDFPTPNGFQKQLGGSQDAYIVKLSSGGDMIQFASYLGGRTGSVGTGDKGQGIAVDAFGNAVVVGSTFTQDFPVSNAFQSRNAGGQEDAFVTQITPAGTLGFSTFLGGSGWDQAFDVAIDSDGNIVLTGFTTSQNFPHVNALSDRYLGGSDDIFITKFDNTGRNLVFSTYWGGTDSDNGVRLAIDKDKNIYVTGLTKSLNFPLKNPPQLFLNGGTVPIGCSAGIVPPCYDGFLIKLHPDGRDADFSTYIGGDDNDSGVSVTVDKNGFIYLVGFTNSPQFYAINAITGAGGFLRGAQDGFVMKLASDASVVVFSSFIGGFGSEGASSVAVDDTGNIYVTGFTTSLDFPVVGSAAQGATAGGQDGFLVKINADDVKTSTGYALPISGGVQVSTAGQSSNPTFGYVAVDVASGLSPTGLEIVDLRSSGTLINEVSIPVPKPDVVGRVYVNTSAADTTALTVVNPNDQEVEFTFFFTMKTGGTNFFGSPIKIPAHAQLSGLLTGQPFNLPADQTGTLTYVITQELPVSVVAFRVIGGSSTPANVYLPIKNPYFADNHPVAIPQIVDGAGWSTQFYLINLSEDTITGELRLYKNDQPGEPGLPWEMQTDQGANSVFSYSIEPRALYTLNGSGAPSDLLTGFAEIVPSAGSTTPLAYAVLLGSQEAGLTETTVEGVEAASDFRMYAETRGNYPADTLATTPAIGLANSSDTPATVTLKLTGFDGSDSGLSAQVTLQPKGHLSRFLYEIPGFENLPTPYSGILHVTTTQAGVTFVGFRARYNERGRFLVTATGPLKDLGNVNPVIFPHLVDGGGYATQFIVIDAIGSGAAGSLRFVNPVGNPLNISIEE